MCVYVCVCVYVFVCGRLASMTLGRLLWRAIPTSGAEPQALYSPPSRAGIHPPERRVRVVRAPACRGAARGHKRKQPLPELPAGADPTTLPYLKTAPLVPLQSKAALFFPHGIRTTVGTPSVPKFRCPRPHIVHSSRCVPFAQSHVHTHGSDIPTRTPGGSQCGSRKEKSSSPPSVVAGAMQLKRLSQW